MPEKGQSILRVRKGTAKRAKELAQARGLTINELVNELIGPVGKAGWFMCSVCRAKVKTENPHEQWLECILKPSQLTTQDFWKLEYLTTSN